MRLTSNKKKIDTLTEVEGITPVVREYYSKWSIQAFSRQRTEKKGYLSPNRRDFYKVMLVTSATGIFSLGTQVFYIDKPTIIFIHPAEIMSWKSLSDYSETHYCLFKKGFAEKHFLLNAVINKSHLFSDTTKSVISLSDGQALELKIHFIQMEEENKSGGPLAYETMQVYLQLIMVKSLKIANYSIPDSVTDDYNYIYQFFELLEKETENINFINPIRIKTVKEFADSLGITPNYLNYLLKKHTGQQASVQIKRRLLDESKALLLQTDWTLQDIGFAIGFSDQPNFSAFFKKSTGLTPAEFRKKES